MKILAINGISISGKEALENGGFEVIETKVAQEQLENYINNKGIDAIIVNNAIAIQQELIDECPSLKLIATTDNTTENIDVQYAQDNGLHVINALEATATAKAELVFAHLLGMTRFLHQANREMPLEGDMNFTMLQKHFVGTELKGKTLGIIGFDVVGREVAKIALALGMKVIATKNQTGDTIINIPFYNGQFVNIEVETETTKEIIKEADFIAVLADKLEDGYILGKEQFEKMKKGMGIVNISEPGTVDEVALVNAIEAQIVKYAGLDVFENQPTPEIQLLMKPELSLSPNIAGNTEEATDNVGLEIANQIVTLLS